MRPVVVFTPRSGWWHSVAERGGGLAIWLELARHFSREPPKRSVILIANTGHELGHIGFEAFLESAPELFATTSDHAGAASAWIHLGANFASLGSQVRLQFSDEEFRDATLLAFAKEGLAPDLETPIGTRPYGEAREIFDREGRFVSLL